MKRQELEREGKEWVKEGIISEEQLNRILARKKETGPNYIIILFAVLLTGLGFLTFIMSEWARQAHLSRVVILLLVTLFFYILGDILHRKNNTLYGISFIVLGYIVFGSGLLLVIDIYQVTLFSAWPFIIWTAVGLVLFYLYQHPLLYFVLVVIGTIGQLYNGLSFSDFNWILFVVMVLGAGYFAFREELGLYYYLLAASFALQSIVLTMTVSEHYYWYLIPILILYLVGDALREQENAVVISYVTLISIFIYGMFQTLLLQDEWYSPQIPSFDTSFFIVWLFVFIFALYVKWRTERKEEMVDFVLFLPIVLLPQAHLFSIIVLFVFSLGWIFIGYRIQLPQRIMLGTVAFLFSTFNVYIQYAWDALNKSLFFFIGGVLLFLISFIFERQRRRLKKEGSDLR
ncbi:DUF2157 domain-containing protein [Oceanobacillus luteolus]|uniref:DUF2157 domain-containing protein n=1 Tax=Oceanobacillus luteolus TaxID=1274358 RepID=UPI00203BD3CE|nr:DUF2157 domain-containing protein [Oceanobacillus luteolus]MCM3741081.1 DUF2157 domain-containing protein [Oceanobacillus luteolus]